MGYGDHRVARLFVEFIEYLHHLAEPVVVLPHRRFIQKQNFGSAGDDRGNPVGTVFTALSTPQGVFVRQLALGGDRERIRTLSAHHALDLLRRYLTDQMTGGE